MSVSRLERASGAAPHYTWGRKDEEYIADFQLVAKRALNETEYCMFKLHFLLGADWRLCCQKLNLDRGTFFHLLYRLEGKLGRVFRELEPYCLYPLGEYFDNARKQAVRCTPLTFKVRPIRPPLRRPRIEPFLRTA